MILFQRPYLTAALIVLGLIGLLIGFTDNLSAGLNVGLLLVVAALLVADFFTQARKTTGSVCKNRDAIPQSSGKQAPGCELVRNVSVLRTDDSNVFRSTNCISMLEVLYDVAASINTTRDVSEVLMRFLHTLTEIVSAKAGVVHLLVEDGQLNMVAHVGDYETRPSPLDRVEPLECSFNQVLQSPKTMFFEQAYDCEVPGQLIYIDGQPVSAIAVPLRFRGHCFGVYSLFVEPDCINSYSVYEELFTCIGRFLGMAIEKARFDEEAQRLTIMDERARLANELHDSLAQTIASVRFQVRVLDETLHEGNEASTWAELEKIENSLDEANAELRALIGHFRAPYDKQGVIVGVERVVQRFRQQSDITIYFQKEWPANHLPADYELHIIRIIQEALANIRKHSKAKTVRVLLTHNDCGDYRILIEDDGVGFSLEPSKRDSGDHIGLSIMKDRARRVGGTLAVESEPGEGTSIEFKFSLPPEIVDSTINASRVADANET